MAKNMNDLINAISDSLSYGDILAAQQLAKISAMIVKARMDRGMTQKEFASLLGVSQGMVSKWESEDYNFTIEALAHICDKLGWDMNVELKPQTYNKFSKVRNRLQPNWKNKSDSNVVNKGFEVAS